MKKTNHSTIQTEQNRLAKGVVLKHHTSCFGEGECQWLLSASESSDPAMTKPRQTFGLALAMLFCCAAHCAAVESPAKGFYKQSPLFSTCPDEKVSSQSIDRFGPVGIGIELVQPAFAMKVRNVEKDSPAEATGMLEKGQIIESINGQKLADIDPRIQLGRIIEAAEASDGVVRLLIKDTPEAAVREVLVKIPVLGAYSNTWPLDCPKSNKIVRGFADYLARPGANKGFGGIGMLFLLSTGEDKDLATVRDWVHGHADKSVPTYAWHLGYGGIPLTEYYLRTGDAAALLTIQKWVDSAVKAQYLDGWAGRGGVPAVTYGGGGGHLNAGGTAVVTFLLLAKECGANVPDHALHGALTHFYRFAARGNNPYGDNRPEQGFVDNGKNGNLAFAMAAAASLTPNGGRSVYAEARDAAAMSGFYTTTFMLHGHTGGGIGEIWRSAAMGLLHDKKPAQYREFMDNRKWHYDLSRRWDGSFGILGGAAYDTVEWGAGYALTYTIPRKTLRISGALKTQFAHEYKLPERPWGTKSDDAFASLEPVPDQDGQRPDFSQETLAADSAKPLLVWFSQPDVSDEVLRRYSHHPDPMIRLIAARKSVGLDTVYLGKASNGGGKVRPAIVLELIKSQDPRVRRAVVDAVASALSGDALVEFIKPEILDFLLDMLKNPEESWWVKDAVLNLFGRTSADAIAPHVDLIVPFLKHEEWWLQNAALTALTPVVADERCCQKVLPAIGAMLRTCQHYNATAGPMDGICAKLQQGSPEALKLASTSLKISYTRFAGMKTAPGGQNITTVYDSQVKFLAASLAGIPGGYDMLYAVAKDQFPHEPLPYPEIFLSADPEQFGPELKQAIGPIIRDKLIYEYIGKNRASLLAESQANRQSSNVASAFDHLAGLYRKIGIHDYDWRSFDPNLKHATWDYFTFDPPEQQKYDISPWRYRKVTYPQGIENWFTPGFDPAKAGWRKGQVPFGQYQGKVVTDAKPRGRFSCPDPMRTLWDKEVLLVRGTFRLPPFKPGHLYRIVIGTGSYVGAGDGYRLYLNGKQLVEVKEGIGRNMGGTLRGAFITKEFLDEFGNGPVTLAAITFLRYGDRAIVTMPPIPQGIFSMWIEVMKIPPLDDATLRKSATVIPMLSAAWQEKQDPDNKELQTANDKFHFDGKFIANPKLLGAWTAVALVPAIDAFDPAKPVDANRAPIKAITVKEGGLTDSAALIWSGETLMDLDRYHALKMTSKTIGGGEYLFVEAGGFSDKNPVGWKSPLIVMKRK